MAERIQEVLPFSDPTIDYEPRWMSSSVLEHLSLRETKEVTAGSLAGHLLCVLLELRRMAEYRLDLNEEVFHSDLCFRLWLCPVVRCSSVREQALLPALLVDGVHVIGQIMLPLLVTPRPLRQTSVVWGLLLLLGSGDPGSYGAGGCGVVHLSTYTSCIPAHQQRKC